MAKVFLAADSSPSNSTLYCAQGLGVDTFETLKPTENRHLSETIGSRSFWFFMLMALLPSGSTQAAELGDAILRSDIGNKTSRAALSPLSPTASANSLSVDTSQREPVRNFYNGLYSASENIPIGWTGSVAACNAGVTSQAYRDAIALRINMIRALAGVPAAVTFSDENNTKAQQAALMMSANNQLNHSPPNSWFCYSAEGAEAAGNSNLGIGHVGPEAIAQGYLADLGANNAAVGHRRWLLYPQTQQMGTGDVSGDGTVSHPTANALWIIDSHNSDPRPATRDDFVAWPPPGFIPQSLVFPRWSLSYPDADFKSASVSMRRNGVNVPVTLEPLADGAGENTLVWLPTDSLLTNPAPLASADATFSVSVQNVLVGGQTRSFNYKVTLIDPDRHSTDTVVPKIVGSSKPANGQNNPYYVTGKVPLADGYDWLYAKVSDYNAIQGAENGLGDMVAATTPGYSTIASDDSAGGSKSYHLNHAAGCTSQTLTLNKSLLPGSPSILSFYSRLGVALSQEVATVQVSIDGGSNWKNVYTQAGSTPPSNIGNPDLGEQTFFLRTVSLASFSGKMIKVRFNFQQASQCYQPGNDVGWYIDNVAFDNVAGLTTPIIKAATADGAFTFKPPSTGNFVLAGRGTILGHPLEWGDFKAVSTSTGGETFILSVAKDGEGTVSSVPAGINCGVICAASYAIGSSVKLTAAPSATYLFAGWGGACSGAATTCTVTMSAAKNVTASFARYPRSSWKRALIPQ